MPVTDEAKTFDLHLEMSAPGAYLRTHLKGPVSEEEWDALRTLLDKFGVRFTHPIEKKVCDRAGED